MHNRGFFPESCGMTLLFEGDNSCYVTNNGCDYRASPEYPKSAALKDKVEKNPYCSSAEPQIFNTHKYE